MPIPDQMSISRPMLRRALIAVNTIMDELVLVDPTHTTEVENGTVRCANDLITAYTATNEIRYDVSNNIGDDTSLIKAGTKLDLYVDSLNLLNTKLESIANAAPPGSILASRATRLKGVISHQFDYIEHCLATDWLSRYSAIRHRSSIRRKSWPDPLVAGWRSVDDLWEPLQQLKGLREQLDAELEILWSIDPDATDLNIQHQARQALDVFVTQAETAFSKISEAEARHFTTPNAPE